MRPFLVFAKKSFPDAEARSFLLAACVICRKRPPSLICRRVFSGSAKGMIFSENFPVHTLDCLTFSETGQKTESAGAREKKQGTATVTFPFCPNLEDNKQSPFPPLLPPLSVQLFCTEEKAVGQQISQQLFHVLVSPTPLLSVFPRPTSFLTTDLLLDGPLAKKGGSFSLSLYCCRCFRENFPFSSFLFFRPLLLQVRHHFLRFLCGGQVTC